MCIPHSSKRHFYNIYIVLIYYNIILAAKSIANSEIKYRFVGRVATVEVLHVIVLYADYSRIIVEELKTVALLYQPAFAVICKRYAAFARTLAGSVIAKRCRPVL